MSYISAIVPTDISNVVFVWERDVQGQRVLKEHSAPYYFYVDDPKGKYKTIYDTPVTKIDCGDNRGLFYNRRKEFRAKGTKIWESDIGPDLRVLSNQYYDIPAPKLNITFLDIENDYNRELGYSGPKNPYAPINAISLFHEHRNKMVALAVPPGCDGIEWTSELLTQEVNDRLPLDDTYETEIIVCKDERMLLELFLMEVEDSDILCGWNSEKFDFPFIGKRIEIVLGRHRLRDLSFPAANMPSFSEVEDRIAMKFAKPGTPPQTYIRLETSGRMLADYMILFKKYEPSEKPSYKLATISEDILVDEDENPLLPKLEYSGSLYDVYRADFAYFVRYNIRDSEILHGFEKKLAYVELANQMYHLSCALFQHVGGTLKLADLAIVNHCHHVIKRVVNDVTEPPEDKQIEGALVLLPQIGMHRMLGSIDINSLYPTAIRSLNISPEKLRGQFIENERACVAIKNNELWTELTLVLEEDGSEITASAAEWREFLWHRRWAVSGYGTVFDQDRAGIIPTVLTGWFAQRKKYQALKKEAEKNHDEETAGYYDRLQYVYKIKLNSLYGALSNLYFRFYDLRMGESTTGTGRMILRHQCRKVNEVLEGNYDIDIPMYARMEDAIKKGHSPDVALDGPIFNGKFQSETVIYGDTDSTYFALWTDDVEDAIKVADGVAAQVNDSYQPFMRDTFLCQPEFDDLVKCGREVVSDNGIFVEKKRYMLHLVDIEGKRVDKCKVMGLDTKKTTLPAAVSKELNKFIERYLKGETWEEISVSIVDYKATLEHTTDIMSIGLPKGIKNVEMYTDNLEYDRKTRLPGHVAAAILYNQMLIEYEDRVSLPISSGMKIKVFNLKAPYGRFKSIAIPTDAEFVPEWFLENFVIDRKLHVEKLVDNPLQNILKAVGKRPPSKMSLNVSAEWEF